MKFLILFCAGLLLTVFAHAQTPRFNYNNNTSNLTPPDKLKVTLSKDSMFIIYKNQEIPAASIQALDSLLKKVPIGEKLTVEFESINAEPEKKRSVNEVLKQCHCRIIGHSVTKNLQ
jgi:hypothetical protein